MEITEEDIKKLARMEATMMFIELEDQFGMYARYYDPTSLELLDEKIEVMRQMKEGVPFELIPNSKDILEGLVKIGPDGRPVERGDVGSKLDLLARLLEERYSERCVSSRSANPCPRRCTEASHTTATRGGRCARPTHPEMVPRLHPQGEIARTIGTPLGVFESTGFRKEVGDSLMTRHPA